jgi:hypothetical protein
VHGVGAAIVKEGGLPMSAGRRLNRHWDRRLA